MGKTFTITLRGIEELARRFDYRCLWCGAPLRTASSYDHNGGIYVAGHERKQRVYFTCPCCGYHWALWKLMK